MAEIAVLTTPWLVAAADTNINSLDLSQCANVKHHSGAQGAVDVTLKVTVGTVKFSVDTDPGASNPLYAVDDVVKVRLWVGNVLKFKATTIADAFEITI